ncbi:YceI family protein [Fundidesulfovibrio agrisoli]|uniref:YceI family protein n=1 Tax=Fundidesulfovibrio agrisoli TaxID=2922717 RepID=UPI001FAE2E6C|nr:YceI family protein [Fundidesulfovibrio agrisoli]
MNNETFPELTLEEVKLAVESGGAMLVDVLPPEHFERRHIHGAFNACVYQVVFLDMVAKLAPDKSMPIILSGAGAGSMDVHTAAQKLRRAGYANISVYPGGIEECAEAGYSLEGSAAQSLDQPFPAFAPEPRLYKLTSGDAAILWTGRNHNISHHGTLSVSRAEMDFTQGVRSGFKGLFEIDMTSIADKNLEGDPLKDVLEAHLASDDFFFVSLFPTAVFTLTEATPAAEGTATRPNYVMTGQLSLRGVGKTIFFPAHLRMLGDGKIGLHANFDFDRTDWGVIYGSARFFRHLGMHVVYDHISVEIRLVLE